MRLLIWLFTFGLAMPLTAQTSAWIFAGPSQVTAAPASTPRGGPIAALASGPNGTVYAGGLGGVWVYHQAGWTRVSNGAPVSALAISVAGLYAGSGDALDGAQGHAGTGLDFSPDGTNWRPLAAPVAGLIVTKIAVDSAGARLWLATMVVPDSPATAQAGLYAYDPQNMSWTRVLSGDIWDVAWDPGSQTLLAATAGGVEFSSNGGASFQPVASVPAGAGAVCVNPASGFYALAGAAAAAGLYAIGSDGVVKQQLALPPEFSAGRLPWAMAAAGTQLWLTGGEVWSTSDAGQHWTNVSQGVAPGIHALLPLADGSLWVGGDQGVWSQAAAGAGLTSRNATLNNAAPLALALTPGGAAAVLDGSGVATGTVGGSGVWSVVNGSADVPLLASDGSNSSAGLYGMARGGGTLERSNDGGATWTPAGTIGGLSASALAAGSSSVWIGGSDGQLWSSSDGGVSFTAVSSPTSEAVHALAAVGKVVAVAAGTEIWTGSAAGGPWTELPGPGGEVSALALDPAHPDLVIAAAGGNIAALLPGSSEWTALPQGLPPAPVTAVEFDGGLNLWAATLGSGLWQLPFESAGLTLTLTPAAASVAAGGTLSGLTAQASALDGPVANAAVTFSASENGNAVWASPPITTGADGRAVLSGLPAPTMAGQVTVKAEATDGWAAAAATSAVSVTAGAPARLKVNAGAGQSLTGGSVTAIGIEVDDAYGNPVAGQAVTFTSTGGGAGAFSPASVTTGIDGQATVAYTLPAAGASAQTVSLAANSGSLSASWSETILPLPNYTLSLSTPAPVAPDQPLATLALQLTPSGGFNQTVKLACSPDCSLSSASLGPPYAPVTVTVDIGAGAAETSSQSITVAADALHAVSAEIPLQGFTIAAGSGGLALAAAGSTIPIAVTITPINGFTADVSFQATGLPAGMTPVFNPVTVAVGTGGAQTKFSVEANRAGLPPLPPCHTLPPGWVWILALGAGTALLAQRRRRAAGAALTFAVALALSGCGGGGGGAPAAPATPAVSVYPVQVIASSGRLQTAITLNLSVTGP